jgi:hypothetical protein
MDDSQVETLINVVAGFLTPEQAKTAMAWLWLAGVVLAAVRWALAKWAPRFSNSAVVVMADRVLHTVVANSKPLELRKNVMKERLSSIPPKRRSAPPFAILCLVFLAGCAGSLEQRLRGQLDGSLAIAEASYEVASETCGKPERCEAIDDAYLRIADIGEAALHALDEGRVEQAQDMYKQLAAQLRGLKR